MTDNLWYPPLEDVKHRVISAICGLYRCDWDLLNIDANERYSTYGVTTIPAMRTAYHNGRTPLNDYICGAKGEGKIITIEFMPCSKQEMRFREMQAILKWRLLFNVSVPVQYKGIT